MLHQLFLSTSEVEAKPLLEGRGNLFTTDMQKLYRIFLLAQNRLLRESLIRLLNGKNGVRIVGASDYSSTVHRQVAAARPQILLLDRHGLSYLQPSLISTLHLAIRNLGVVMVDMESTESTFLRAVQAGVVGYILKDASLSEVVSTIRAVGSGQAVCPPSLAKFLLRQLSSQKSAGVTKSWRLETGLSRREQQIVELLRERLTNKEIAARLNLSEQTIKNHVHHILRKAGVSSRLRIVERCQALFPYDQDNSYNSQPHVNSLPHRD